MANDTDQKVTTMDDAPTIDTAVVDNPADDLAKLKKLLEEALAAHADAGKKIEQLKTEVGELGKAVTEIDQKVKAWEKAVVTIKEQQKVQKSYFDREKKELESTLSESDQKLVKDARAKGNKKVTDLKMEITVLLQSLADSKVALAKAEATKVAMTQAYKAQVDLATRDSDLLKDLAKLHGDADKEEAKNNVLRQYFLILEGDVDFSALHVPSVKEYEDGLNKAVAAATTASDAERAAKLGLEKAQVDLQTAQKKLADAETNRRTDSLNSIPENTEATLPG